MDIDAIIRAAKLGRERKDAQVETCTVFAAGVGPVIKLEPHFRMNLGAGSVNVSRKLAH